MNWSRLAILVGGLRRLRRPPDITALRTARTPTQLSKVALIPAARNLGIALGLLPKRLRIEATAALLACRVLDAYEDLGDRELASTSVAIAAAYLTGASETPPPPLQVTPVRDSDRVDLVLADRISDIRALIAGLPPSAFRRVCPMLTDVAGVMARNLVSRLPRGVYSEGVLGRVARYACALLIDSDCEETELGELACCVGVTAQLANDLRDDEFALYGVASRTELTQAVMLRLLTPAMGTLAFLAAIGDRTRSRGALAAMAYMTVTTARFLCISAGTPPPPVQPVRIALRAAVSSVHWNAMVQQVLRWADGAIQQTLNTGEGVSATPELVLPLLSVTGSDSVRAVGPLVVDAAIALARALPDEPLIGELPNPEVRRMMVADHLAFGALDQLVPRDAVALAALAAQFQDAALGNPPTGARS